MKLRRNDTTIPRDPAALPSIAGRLNRLVVVAVGAALLVAALLNIWHEADRYVAAKRETLLATAQVFGAAAAADIAARDNRGIMEALRAIGRVPGLMRAEVTDMQGRLLADIGEGTRLTTDPRLDSAHEANLFDLLTSRSVQVAVPVVSDGRPVGRLLLISDISGLGGQLLSGLLVTAGGGAVALVIGLLLASSLQRSISAPLVALTAAMAGTRRDNGYDPVREVGGDRETVLLARGFNGMIAAIRRGTDEILAREDEIIGRLSRAAEQRDDQTGQHVIRVAKVSGILARSLGLDPAWIADLCRASPMHDVGKISIPDAILFKPGRLDPEERRIMEQHAEAGHRVLAGSQSRLVQLAAEIALTHHERWDGQGYPRRIAGEAIPLPGRITAVADVCDALLSARPYKQPWSLPQVREHLLANAGSHFDPRCVMALLERWDEVAAIYADQAAPSAAA